MPLTSKSRSCAIRAAESRGEKMEMFEGILRFLSGYPSWAKALLLANVACMASILVFVRTPSAAAAQPVAAATPVTAANITPKLSRPTIKVTGVELFPRSDAEVQVLVFVNDTEFRYPSQAGVEWLRVGPSMSGQTFELPSTGPYTLRFEMRQRDRYTGQLKKLVSQDSVALNAQTSGVYNLHQVENKSRGAAVGAEVRYSFDSGR
ncbi:hypothetical protein ACSFBI_03555 [Variovorax sp. RB3P1]|uniref:hypothetical protein n=1 Tax=Variovorax sp. RB3P1 TaxID=3443732 RepID=UPI003F479D5A